MLRVILKPRMSFSLAFFALRQQVTALKQERPRPPLDDTDRAFWVALRSVAGMGEPPGDGSTPTLLLAGIENDSGDTGRRSRGLRHPPGF